MSSKILMGYRAEETIKSVLAVVKEAVGSTLGPDGQLALIGTGQSTWTTKDGVTVAKALQFATDEEELVNRIISEPAIKTDAECGDGTTTTILLTAAIYELLRKDNSFKARKNIEELVGQLLDTLKKQTIFVNVEDELLYLLALTTANQDKTLAQQVIDIYRSCEKGYPDVEVKFGNGAEDLISRVEGRVINMYFASPWFAGDNNGNEVKLDRYIPVIVDDRILQANPQVIFDGLTAIRKATEGDSNVYTPIVMVVRSIEQTPINMISNIITQYNTMTPFNSGGMPGVIVTTTNLGGGLGAAEMQDISSILGAPYVSGLDALPSAQVKVCTTPLTIGHSRSSITGLKQQDLDRINARIGSIEKEISSYNYADKFTTRARINERRIRRLRGEVVTILVGGETNQEIKERMDRYTDVVKAVHSALENGVLPGCGLGLINAGIELFPVVASSNWGILNQLCKTIYLHLMKKHLPEDWNGDLGIAAGTDHIRMLENTGKQVRVEQFPVINIATGEPMNPKEMQVWDTAYATITALKGGFQTAQILATASSVFASTKLHGRITGHN